MEQLPVLSVQHDCKLQQSGAKVGRCAEIPSGKLRSEGLQALSVDIQTSATLDSNSAEGQRLKAVMSESLSAAPRVCSTDLQAMSRLKLRDPTPDQEARSSADNFCTSPLVLPLPELRRQVGVRWPQHDVLLPLFLR